MWILESQHVTTGGGPIYIVNKDTDNTYYILFAEKIIEHLKQYPRLNFTYISIYKKYVYVCVYIYIYVCMYVCMYHIHHYTILYTISSLIILIQLVGLCLRQGLDHGILDLQQPAFHVALLVALVDVHLRSAK